MRCAACLAVGLLMAAAVAHAESPWPPEAEPVAQADAPVVQAPADQGLAARLRKAGKGLASWYGGTFQGKRTASGERFDMHAYTAAHPWLPFGTLVEVTSLVNGRSVIVRINDRGPFKTQRIIDLSKAAAHSLGLVGRGTKPVEIRIAELPAGVVAADPATP